MFAKCVVVVVLALILPAKSQNQRFVQVPFDNNENPTQQFAATPQHQTAFAGTTIPEQPQSFNNFNKQSFQDSGIEPQQHHTFASRPKPRRIHVIPKEPSVLRQTPSDLQNFNQNVFNQVQTRPATRFEPVSRIRTDFFTPAQLTGFEQKPTTPPATRFAHTRFDTQEQFHDTPSSFVSPTHQATGFSSQPQEEVQRRVNTFVSAEDPVVTRFRQQPRVEQVRSKGVHFRAQPTTQSPRIPQQHISPHPRFPEQPEFVIDVQPEAEETPSQQRFSQIRRNQAANLADQFGQQESEQEALSKQQAETAQYSFGSQIDDSINGNHHLREEVRDGLNVKGMYSYSDGYVKRTVFYEADDKGYRIIKQEEEPLGNGPEINPNGHADVSSYVGGNALQYSITSADIQKNRAPAPEQKRPRTF